MKINPKKSFFYCKCLVLFFLSFICLSAFADNLTLFTEPYDNGNVIVNLIANAKYTIDIEVYLLDSDKIINAIVAAQKRGVTVRMILERHPFGQDDNHNENLASLNKLFANSFPQSNIHWIDNNIFSFVHEKAIVIDAETPEAKALILSLNLTDNAITQNRDFGIVDTNTSDIHEIDYIFNMDFYKSSLDVNGSIPKKSSFDNQNNPVIPNTQITSASNLIWSPSRIIPTNNSRESLLNLIYSAKQYIYIEGEELNDSDFERALNDQATNNHVTIHVILPYPSEFKLNNNVSVHCLNADANTPYMHAKMIIVDGKQAYIGSINYSAGSMDMNRELGIVFDDQSIIQQLNDQFKNDWGYHYEMKCSAPSNNPTNNPSNNVNNSSNHFYEAIIGATAVGIGAATAMSINGKSN